MSPKDWMCHFSVIYNTLNFLYVKNLQSNLLLCVRNGYHLIRCVKVQNRKGWMWLLDFHLLIAHNYTA